MKEASGLPVGGFFNYGQFAGLYVYCQERSPKYDYYQKRKKLMLMVRMKETGKPETILVAELGKSPMELGCTFHFHLDLYKGISTSMSICM